RLRVRDSESAHLIWRLRNERVINAKDPASNREITNRWCKTINNRLGIDCAMTNAIKYGKKAIDKRLVLSTWKNPILYLPRCRDTLPKDWTWETGVLVGVGYQDDDGGRRAKT
ncbi:hypothetical protein R3P38DRAFT_2466070, partial [Favolaschia claudopus]